MARSSNDCASDDRDWKRISYLSLVSRTIDQLEETKLVPEKKVLYQFSARGHEVSQCILSSFLTHKHDAVGAYYRSRPILLSLGLSLEDAIAAPMAKSGGFSDGRDIGVVCNLPSKNGPVVIPMSGDVGSQFTPAVGWAQAITYRLGTLKDESYRGAIAVAHTGDGGIATNGFWAALTIATTLKLPMLFFLEDNGFGISVPGVRQTPGGNIAENLASFKNLFIVQSDGTDPKDAASAAEKAVAHVRAGNGPALLRASVPRLSGHSGQDTQAYKSKEQIESERARDPLPKLKSFMASQGLSDGGWSALEKQAHDDVAASLEKALARPEPKTATIHRHVYSETLPSGAPDLQQRGGLLTEGHKFPDATDTPNPEPQRINMITAIRRTLENELKINPKVLVFGEDVGPKGGVHAATLGLQETFGEARVFDTSLSEEGIIGRAVGMALSGLMPVAEIQFRKYADPATEQLNNCGTIRWRTNNRFAAPIVVRMPGGFFKCGDPWHSVSSEVLWAHAIGWQVCIPSNAEDAVGLLRAAMRSNNPTIFFEHRHMLDTPWARRPYPGDNYVLPMGKAKLHQEGTQLSCITWGAMVERCEEAATASGLSVDILDLRTIMPWDKEAVLASVKKTRRCLIVHEDGLTAGFGAEVAATVAAESFFNLDAPVQRVAVPDLPIPHNVALMEAVVPSVEVISQAMISLSEV
jgi:2-oxoisovalerate dehydrogenase E1 component